MLAWTCVLRRRSCYWRTSIMHFFSAKISAFICTRQQSLSHVSFVDATLRIGRMVQHLDFFLWVPCYCDPLCVQHTLFLGDVACAPEFHLF
ncbi:hypothetical protein VNO77_44123 [Canavalia gladiata]|uniref:Uncharacterized protein n=1 Tax=Canavalia gladiata TaxID=3824 RepID=A0AAN9PQG5_CANGL